MDVKTVLVELLLAGFFAIACFRARPTAAAGQRATLGSFLHLTNRIERLKRSRWQWFCMVLLVLILRLQQVQPLTLEFIVAVEFLVFLALPAQTETGRVSTR